MEEIIKRLNELEKLIQEQTIQNKDILSLNEAAKYLGVSKSTLYKMTFENKISYYKPSGKLIYFRKNDLDNFLLKKRIKSNEEWEMKIDSKK